MSKPLTIVARIEAKPGQVDAVKAELRKLIGPTLDEAGCIQYDLHQDNDKPEVFLFYENWDSRELWQAHMASAHLAAFQAATKDTVESVVIHEMTMVEA